MKYLIIPFALFLTACPAEEFVRCEGADVHPGCFDSGADVGNNENSDTNGEMSTPDADPDLPPDEDAGTACDPACSGEAPFCNESTRQCVACLAEGDCSDGVCDIDTNTCVECLEDGDCTEGVCDTGANECVDCVDNEGCTDPAASVCHPDANTCAGCTSSTDCSHLADAGTGICDDASSVCVECLDDDEETRAACGGNSCDPATSTCTATPVGMTGVCEPCVADSECATDHLCVPLQFQGVSNGKYCLKTNFDGCEVPYGETLVGLESANGSVSNFCGIDESQTTCEAILAFGEDCQTNGPTDCAAAGALCETVNSIADRCTYSCDDSLQCPDNRPCSNGYCGGP